MSTPDDKAFDEYLGRESQVSQRYRALEADAVPAHLDAKVLAQAKNALAEEADELSRVRSRRRRLLQWSVPAAVAASALLVVSIVIRSGTQHEITPLAVPAQVPAPPHQPMESPAAKPELADKQQSPTVVMIAPPRDAVTEFSSLARAPASGATARSNASNSAAREEAVVSELSSGFQTEPMVPAPAAAPPPAAAALAGEQDSLAERSAQRVQNSPALQAKRSARQSELEQVTVTSSRPAITVQDAPMAVTSVQVDETIVASVRKDPALWLEHIRELRRDGQDADADEEWKQFRDAYPEHPVAETDIARGQPH